ncbi:MAG: nicotinate-nucleotide--dimethylbenzimidazole phosphoribosyltransferase [Planctomycetes bacterium]|nr:nicotinate-nucleotide--dimethylbenzimidazole phosphoribosyltransferase [Planctomycetota bacterium]
MAGKLEETIAAVRSVDRTLAPQARARLDSLTKPPGSLGRLEDLAVRYCLVTGSASPPPVRGKIFTFAADHGVAAEGVSAFPAEVTQQMVRNMASGGAAINVLADHAGVELALVDIGVDDPLEGVAPLLRRKVRPGTANIRLGPAMSRQEALQAIEIGIDLARQACADGVTLVGAGEMGIANTTPSSALMAALLHCPVADITGRGAGIDDETLARKIEVIEQALAVNMKQLGAPLGALAAVGGLEIAGICGLILGAAACSAGVVVDGFICSAGALAAYTMCDSVRDYLFFSHRSGEAGHGFFLDRFGIAPLLDLDMRLGEGTGAALAMSLIRAAVRIYNEMATFDSAGVSK